MSTVESHTELQGRLVQLYADYRDNVELRLRQQAQRYRSIPSSDRPDRLPEIVEAQARSAFIDDFLDALNWTVSPGRAPRHGHLDVEVRVDRPDLDERYSLDYLGHDSETDRPLLLVEAKRPRLRLPKAQGSSTSAADGIAETIVLALNGHSPENITKEWADLLQRLAKYVQGIHERTGTVPRRVLITNSQWFVIIAAPSVLLPDGAADAQNVLVVPSDPAADHHPKILFDNLSYSKLANRRPILSLSELPGSIDAHSVIGIAFGLRLIYIDTPSFEQRVPVIRVRPFVLLLGRRDCWLIVQGSNLDHHLPFDEAELPEHVRQIEAQGQFIKSQIDTWIGRELPLCTLEQYYKRESFKHLPAVHENGRHDQRSVEFTIVTGEHPHFVRLKPTVPNCEFHDHRECARVGFAGPNALVVRASVAPRSYFTDGLQHHCAHSQVHDVKRRRVEGGALKLCGYRSNNHDQNIGGSFCEILKFEERLCCRTCIFEHECERSGLFRLPCQRRQNGAC